MATAADSGKERDVTFKALALDYDGTLATEGKVDARTEAALERARASGITLLMVTGRELDDLARTFTRRDLFHRIVAENGALLFDPATGSESPLAAAPPRAFADALRARGVAPISVGRVVVATWEPHETTVLATIRDLGLELEVIFNKGAVMVLPSGVNKGTGLRAALKVLGLQGAEVIGMGDAENDHSLFAECGLGVAVDNAIPALKARADRVTRGARGEGVRELIEALLAHELDGVVPRPRAAPAAV